MSLTFSKRFFFVLRRVGRPGSNLFLWQRLAQLLEQRALFLVQFLRRHACTVK
jgi:hypothetical protein